MSLIGEGKDWDESRVIYPSPCINLLTSHKKTNIINNLKKSIPRITIS